MDMYVCNLSSACFYVIPVLSKVLGVLPFLNSCISLSAIVILFQVSSVYSCQYSDRQLVYGPILYEVFY
jgi:hypothetical protein